MNVDPITEVTRETTSPSRPLDIAPLSCIECRRPWLVAGERWRLKLTDDEPREAVPYCPTCAFREFG